MIPCIGFSKVYCTIYKLPDILVLPFPFFFPFSNKTMSQQGVASNQTSWLAWVELACVVLLNMSINLRWLTFSPVASIAAEYLNVNISAITWLSNCATLIYIAICVSTGWVFEKYGMKTCVSFMIEGIILLLLYVNSLCYRHS